MSALCILLFLNWFLLHPTNCSISKFTSSDPLKSLFCNTCAVAANKLNTTLHLNDNEFETQAGFRLDSNGKKIRKKTGFLNLFLKLEDICNSWSDIYRTAKRKSGSLYLITKEHSKLTKETIKTNILKPKLLKLSSKPNKMIQEMCYSMIDIFDDWLHIQQKLFSALIRDEKPLELKEFLNCTKFCLESNQLLCSTEMLSTDIEWFSFKMKHKSKQIKHKSKQNKHKTQNASVKHFLMCYSYIWFVILVFLETKLNDWIKKCFILPLIFIPFYLEDLFGNVGIWFYFWFYHAFRLYDVIEHSSIFQSKSMLFCYSHIIKNMMNAKKINDENQKLFYIKKHVFIFSINLSFVFFVHHFLFHSFFPFIFPSYISIYLPKINIYHLFDVDYIYMMNIIIKCLEKFLKIANILYCINSGFILISYVFGYYFVSHSNTFYSVRDFWKSFNIFYIQYFLKYYVYRISFQLLDISFQATCNAFMVSAVICGSFLYLQEYQPTSIVFVLAFFLLQPFVLFIEDFTNIRMLKLNFFGLRFIDHVVHAFITLVFMFMSVFAAVLVIFSVRAV